MVDYGIGEYVLMHNIKYIEHTDMGGQPLPVWGVIINRGGGAFQYYVRLLRNGTSGSWGVDDDDIVPSKLVTDEQWAMLVEYRLMVE